MTTKEIMIVLSQRAGLTQEGLAAKMGYKSGANIAVPLSRNDGMSMKVETLIRWLDVLDAQLVVQTFDDEELILDGEDEGVTYK